MPCRRLSGLVDFTGVASAQFAGCMAGAPMASNGNDDVPKSPLKPLDFSASQSQVRLAEFNCGGLLLLGPACRRQLSGNFYTYHLNKLLERLGSMELL